MISSASIEASLQASSKTPLSLSPYYYHHQQQPQPQPPTTTAFNPNVSSALASGVTTSCSQVTNGGLLPNHGGSSADGASATALYPQSVAGKAPSPPLEIVRKKRGRPRKYGTSEAATAAKRVASAAALSTSVSPPPQSLSSRKRDQQLIGSPPSSSKKSQSGLELKIVTDLHSSLVDFIVFVPWFIVYV